MFGLNPDLGARTGSRPRCSDRIRTRVFGPDPDPGTQIRTQVSGPLCADWIQTQVSGPGCSDWIQTQVCGPDSDPGFRTGSGPRHPDPDPVFGLNPDPVFRIWTRVFGPDPDPLVRTGSGPGSFLFVFLCYFSYFSSFLFLNCSILLNILHTILHYGLH